MENSDKDEVKPKVLSPDEEIKEAMATFSATAFRGPMHPAVYEKIDKDHIHKILDNAEKDDHRAFRYAKEGRLLKYGTFLIITIVFLLLTYFLVGTNTELYKDILEITILFAGGVGVGKGFLSKRR
jgi:hypothetical protein